MVLENRGKDVLNHPWNCRAEKIPFHSVLQAFYRKLFMTALQIQIVEGVFQKSQQLLVLCNCEEIPVACSRVWKGLDCVERDGNYF